MDSTNDVYLFGANIIYVYFINGGVSVPDIDTTSRVMTGVYGVSMYWTFPCAPGTWSQDGYEHTPAMNLIDTTCEETSPSAGADSTKTNQCNHKQANEFCPFAGECPNSCMVCAAGRYIESGGDFFKDTHFIHLLERSCLFW